jgi:N-dimethylarginine dimethylaminohydrolase
MLTNMKETPSQLNIPSYVMNFPFTLDTKNPNNIWMKELSPDDLQVNRKKAYKQFMDLYNFLSGDGLVYLLPSLGDFQDQVYVANLGIYLPHIKDSNNIVLSNYTSEPRIGEEKIGEAFFKLMNYDTHLCPYKWEGEADLKFIGGNNYIGGSGIRTDHKTYEWMREQFGMNIIDVEMVDDYLYHLDCSIFPLSKEKTMICTSMFDPEEIRDIEKYTQVIDIDEDDALGGITNSVRFGNLILCASNISELSKTHEDYAYEKHKINSLEAICAKEGMEPVFFNLSEYMKSGALLSCMVMHLNYVDYYKQLV